MEGRSTHSLYRIGKDRYMFPLGKNHEAVVIATSNYYNGTYVRKIYRINKRICDERGIPLNDIREEIAYAEQEYSENNENFVKAVYGDGIVTCFSRDDYPEHRELVGRRESEEGQRTSGNSEDLQDRSRGEGGTRGLRFSHAPDPIEDEVYEYMAAHPEIYEQMWTSEETDSNYVKHKQHTLSELHAQVKKLKQNQKKTHGKILDESSVVELPVENGGSFNRKDKERHIWQGKKKL